MISLFTLGSLLLLVSLALAQEPKPSGTLTLSSKSVALGIGVSWGSGVLTYQGKEYPFSIEGLSVADVGISEVDATGTVYHLTKLEDFNGNYAAVSAGAVVGGGMGATSMRNQNGVVMNITGTGQGVKFKLGVDGVKFTLK
jgi:hypothetical protein